MKTNLTILSLTVALAVSPLAFAAPTEDKPGKESTTTSVPVPKPDAPAAGKGTSDAKPGADDVAGKKSTTTAVPVAPGKDTGATATPTK